MDIDRLVNALADPGSFAEEHCEWYADDYVYDCAEHGGDYSIRDSAMDAIRQWAEESEENMETLKREVQ
jgi:hypothetical protein